MAASKAMTTRRETETHPAEREGESLPALISRLGDDVMQLVQSQLTLLKVELRQEAKAFFTGGTMMVAGAVVALVGFAFANVALAFGVSTLFSQSNLSVPAQLALGFLITGLFYVVVGAIVVMVLKNRLAKVDLVPDRTVEELRKDKQWLKNEI